MTEPQQERPGSWRNVCSVVRSPLPQPLTLERFTDSLWASVSSSEKWDYLIIESTSGCTE